MVFPSPAPGGRYGGEVNYQQLFTKNGLSLDRLHGLVEVAEAGTIAAAAPNHPTRQSQLSRQLGELEKFFGVDLKRITGRTAQLTKEGRQLANLAREHLLLLAEFQRAVDRRPLAISLAAGAALHEWAVLPRIHHLRKVTKPAIWHLHTRKNLMMRQQILEGSLDFALLRSDLLKPAKRLREGGAGEWGNKAAAIAASPLGTINYSVFVPDKLCPRATDLPLARILAELPIATQGDDTQFQLTLESAVREKNWRLNVVFYGETFPQVARAVEGGTMAGILPDIALDSFDLSRVWCAPLKGLVGLRREVSLAWNPARLERFVALQRIRPLLEQVLRF